MADLLYGHETYTDITDQFRKECEKLEPVELVKRNKFSLLQGVHAMEMGHSRMDTGLQYKSLEEQLASAPKIESAQDVLELVTLLFCREMSWQSGPMLVQNVLSCWYVEKVLQEIKATVSDKKTAQSSLNVYLQSEISSWNDILKIYILIMIKTISSCADMMLSSPAIYPDEDIVLEKSFDMLEEVDPQMIFSIIKRGIEFVRKHKENGSKTVEEWLEFRLQLLRIFINKIQNTSEARRLGEKLKKGHINENSRFISTFSVHIQTRIDYPCPFRPLTSADITEAWEKCSSILQFIQEFHDIYGKFQCATDRMSYVVSFGAKNPFPLPIVRAILASTIRGEEWVAKDIIEVSGPDALKKHTGVRNDVGSDELQTIVLTAAGIYEALLICFCQNRSRRRQNFSHAIILWDRMQAMVETHEEKLIKSNQMDMVTMPDGTPAPALPLSSWVYMRKLQIMIWTVLLGFELEIYGIWEYPAMWGYVHYLMDISNSHLTRIRTYLQSKIQKNKRDQGNAESFGNSHRYISALELEGRYLSHLSGANQYLSLALEKRNMLSRPRNMNKFANEESVYKLRMKPFSTVEPPIIPYEQAKNQNFTFEICVAAGKNLVSASKILLEQLDSISRDNPELLLLKRSSVGVGVTIGIVERLPEALLKTRKVVAEFRNYHWFFPVLTLKAKEEDS